MKKDLRTSPPPHVLEVSPTADEADATVLPPMPNSKYTFAFLSASVNAWMRAGDIAGNEKSDISAFQNRNPLSMN